MSWLQNVVTYIIIITNKFVTFCHELKYFHIQYQSNFSNLWLEISMFLGQLVSGKKPAPKPILFRTKFEACSKRCGVKGSKKDRILCILNPITSSSSCREIQIWCRHHRLGGLCKQGNSGIRCLILSPRDCQA